MCSYPCFGLSKTGFTPPSQLLKLIKKILKKEKLCRCRCRNRQRKLRRYRCRNRQRKLSHQFIYIHTYIFSWVFTNGVQGFINFATSISRNFTDGSIRCPCRKCKNLKFLHQDVVTMHLLMRITCVGMHMKNYLFLMSVL